MTGILTAFTTIWTLTVVGWLIGRYQILGPGAEQVLARLVFFVATPALLFATLATSSMDRIVTPALAAFVISTVVVAAASIAAARLLWRRSPAESVVAGLCGSYVNAANLGIPVAAYALGDVSFVAPVLLFQVLVASPIALTVLETLGTAAAPRPVSPLGRLIALPARNPIMLGSAAGLLLAVANWRLNDEVLRPFQLIGQAAVPTALLALGVSLSLRSGPSAPAGAEADETGGLAAVPRAMTATLASMKLVAQPLVAYAVGRLLLGLSGPPLLAAVITSGLPTAQNVFVFATRYRQGAALARNSVVVSTVLAALTLTGFAFWLS